MKPKPLLESDPINNCFTTKPKVPFRIPEEVPNGNYGLIINGYSLVGKPSYSSALFFQGIFILGPTHFRENSRPRRNPVPLLFRCLCLTNTFLEPSLGRNNEETEAKSIFLPYPKSSLLMWPVT